MTSLTPELRLAAGASAKLRTELSHTGAHEPVAFGLARQAFIAGRPVLLVRDILTLPPTAFVRTSAHGAKWRGGAMRSILNEAMARQSGIVIFHPHPHAGAVDLSGDDRRSARELLPVFQNLVPEQPHASVVVGHDHAACLLLLPDDREYDGPLSLRWLGSILDSFPPPPFSAGESVAREFHRQEMLIGAAGQRRLRRARVAVVGLGGGGSHAVQQLAHMGLGEIIGIDDDRVEDTNRGRLIGMTWWDSWFWRRRKIDVMRRMVRRINRHVRFTGIPYPLPDQRAIDAVKNADIVIGCLDTLHARADLQDLAWRFLIPYIDIGLLIRPPVDGNPLTIGGHVATLVPGHFCLWCIDALTRSKLDAETDGRPRSYIKGAAEQAQVVSMNGVLASQAVSEVLQLVTGYAPIDPQLTFKKFDGLDGTLRKWAVKPRVTCDTCCHVLAAGDALWNKA